MKYFSSPSFYVRTYTALTRTWRAQPGDCFGIFALKDQKVGQLLTRLTWKLFCLPCRHFHNLSASLIFHSLFFLFRMLSVISTYNKQQNSFHWIGFSFLQLWLCDCLQKLFLAKHGHLFEIDGWPDQIIWQRYVLSVLCTKRSINETGFEVLTYTAILDDSRVSQCKLRQVVNKSPEPRFHHKTASLRHFTYIYEQCKKSRQKQIEKVQWRRRVFAN